MRNVIITQEKEKVILTFDSSINLGPSTSGKTDIIASTGGSVQVDTPNGPIMVGLNAFKRRGT